MKKLTFIQTKKKHLKICYHLLKGCFYLLINRKFSDYSEGMKIIRAFDGGQPVRDFLYNLTNYWIAEEAMETYGINSEEVNKIAEQVDDYLNYPIEKPVEKTPDFHAKFRGLGETQDFNTILQNLKKENPVGFHLLCQWTGKENPKKN